MADISKELQQILDAMYGEDVRGSIHDAIALINSISEKVLTVGTQVTSESSSIQGYFKDSVYFNTDTLDLWKCDGAKWAKEGNFKGILKIETTESLDDEGENIVKIYLTDGSPATSLVIRNGHKGSTGNGISSIDVTESTDDGGENQITINMTDGTNKPFSIRNGSKGSTGNGISSIDVTESTDDGGENQITINMTDGTNKPFSIRNGKKGTPGVSVENVVDNGDGSFKFELSNGTETDNVETIPGKDGNVWYRGSEISGKVTLPTVFVNSGIPYANKGDNYLNKDEGAIYHCENAGDPDNATWVYDTTLTGGGGGASEWSDIDGKPFENIGKGLKVNEDGELESDGVSNWDSLEDKPFEALGSDFEVKTVGEGDEEREELQLSTNVTDKLDTVGDIVEDGFYSRNIYNPSNTVINLGSGHNLSVINNKDGSITLSGTNGGNYSYIFIFGNFDSIEKNNLEIGKSYKLNGLTTVSGISYILQIRESSSGNDLYRKNFGDEYFTEPLEFTIPNGAKVIRCNMAISPNTVIDTPITIYPMVTDASNTDYTYIPYAKSNVELTNEISKAGPYSNGETITLSYVDMLGISNANGTDVTFKYSLPREITSAMQKKIASGNYTYEVQFVRGGGSIIADYSITGVSVLAPNVIAVSTTGTYAPMSIYLAQFKSLIINL